MPNRFYFLNKYFDTKESMCHQRKKLVYNCGMKKGKKREIRKK